MTGNKLLHSDSKYSHLSHPHDYHCWVVSEHKTFLTVNIWTSSLQKKQVWGGNIEWRLPSIHMSQFQVYGITHTNTERQTWQNKMSAVTPSGFKKSKTFLKPKAIYISLVWSQSLATLVEQLLHLFIWRGNKLEKLQYVSVINPNWIK